MAMSLAMPDTMALFHRTRSVVSAFREVGFKTFWLSNQGAHRSAVGNEIALMMEEAEVVQTSNFGFWNSVLDESFYPSSMMPLPTRHPASLSSFILWGATPTTASEFLLPGRSHPAPPLSALSIQTVR